MDGNDSPNESISDSCSTNNLTSSLSAQVESVLTSSLNAQADCSSVTVTPRNSPWCHSNVSCLSEDNVSESPRPIPVVTGRLPPASQPSLPPWHNDYQRRPADLPSTRKTYQTRQQASYCCLTAFFFCPKL